MTINLSEDQIKGIIKDYIDDNTTDYAIMINGKWGSGKTFFIKNKVVNELEAECEQENKQKVKFIYISVYGINETKTVDGRIYDELVNEFLRIGEVPTKVKKVIESVYKIAGTFKKLPKIPMESIRNLIAQLQKLDSYVFIFDDIERCEMPISELMGYINDFVEHKKVKAIIIANEDEILRKNLNENAELKYLVAESELLNIPKEENYFNKIMETKENNESKLDIKEIDRRVEMIFGEDRKYKLIKEKLIKNTIQYIPNLDEVINEIIKVCVKNNSVKETIEANKRRIVNIMENKGHINIRTLKTAISIMSKVLEIVQKVDLSTYDENEIKSCKDKIMDYTMYACINYKDGKWHDEDAPEIFSIVNEKMVNESTEGFKFIDEIIEKSYFDEERIKTVVLSYMKVQARNLQAYDNPINNLRYCCEMEDKEIIDNYENLKKKLEDGIYSIETYPKILYRVFKITKIGFSNDYLDTIKEIMIRNIQSNSEVVELNDYELLDVAFDSEEIKEEFNEVLKDVKKAVDEKNNKNRIFDINEIIKASDGWGEKFHDYCSVRSNGYRIRKCFFNNIDIDNLIEVIKKSNTKDISDFRRNIYTIYDINNIKEIFFGDLPQINKFYEDLNELINSEEYEEYGVSKKYNINLLKDNMCKIIQRMNESK